jgi:hypothetical protein
MRKFKHSPFNMDDPDVEHYGIKCVQLHERKLQEKRFTVTAAQLQLWKNDGTLEYRALVTTFAGVVLRLEGRYLAKKSFTGDALGLEEGDKAKLYILDKSHITEDYKCFADDFDEEKYAHLGRLPVDAEVWICVSCWKNSKKINYMMLHWEPGRLDDEGNPFGMILDITMT